MIAEWIKKFSCYLSINKINIIFLLNIVLFFGLVFFCFYSFFWLNMKVVVSWHLGFIDPSTAFAEALIKLYNFVWFFLIIILSVVILLLTRMLYLFSWNIKYINNFFIKKLVIFCLVSIQTFCILVRQNITVERITIILNRIDSNEQLLTIWYELKKEYPFLFLNDMSEYKRLEVIWCVLPAAVLATLIGPSFSLAYSLDPAINPVLTVKVVGHQWYWNYSMDVDIEYVEMSREKFENSMLYTELLIKLGTDIDLYKWMIANPLIVSNLVSEKMSENFVVDFDSVMILDEDLKEGTHRVLEVDNRLVLPVGLPIRFLITSTDVLHAWAIPAFGLKVDAVPGRLNQFIVEIKKPGVYYGQCSELCGPLHGFMPIVIEAVMFDDFIDWLDKKKTN